jgi:hypothetical protein
MCMTCGPVAHKKRVYFPMTYRELAQISSHTSCWKPVPRGRSGPEAGRSMVVARTVRACAESVRVPIFSRDLLPKTAGLTRKSV